MNVWSAISISDPVAIDFHYLQIVVQQILTSLHPTLVGLGFQILWLKPLKNTKSAQTTS
jgi:hypothetical protein